VAEVADAAAADATLAVEAAATAFPAWSRRSGRERGRCLRDWHVALLAEAEDLARLITREQGKPLAEAQAEVAYAADFLDWYAEEARRATGEVIPAPVPGRRLLAVPVPVGLVLAITPWNFPLAMLARKAAAALAAGCTLIAKPAEQTPLTALAFAGLGHRAGLPAGCLNVLPTSAPAPLTAAVLADTRVRKLTFTGSTATGRELMRAAAGDIKRLSLELGGCAPMLVLADADLERAVRATVASRFRNAGQTCISVNRVLVESAVFEPFLERLVARVEALRVGPGEAADSEIGPLIDDAAVARVADWVARARASGARLCTGGERHPAGPRYFRPTVLELPESGCAGLGEEVFGPVLTVQPVRDEAAAIAAANATSMGLAAYLQGQDLERLWRMAERLEAGMVGVNEVALGSEVTPFGGVKQSGFGREGWRDGLEEFLDTRFIAFGSPQ
jgi:succinate-semialdehyde dehydrogenase/glutarate-semialdehyde dehydrogenase